MESNEAVGQRIAKAREFLGLTQAVVARLSAPVRMPPQGSPAGPGEPHHEGGLALGQAPR